jgi:phage shock protein A
MTEQEVQTIEHTLERLSETISQLTQQKREMEERIGELKGIRILLALLLPPEKQDERLLSVED